MELEGLNLIISPTPVLCKTFFDGQSPKGGGGGVNLLHIIQLCLQCVDLVFCH